MSRRFRPRGDGVVVSLTEAEAELLQHRRRDQEAALVRLPTQGAIGVQGVEPAILQRVGPQLVHEPDPAPFLREVEHSAGPLLAHQPQRRVQLRSAVAAQATEQVAREALRVRAHERGALRGRVLWPADQDGEVLNAALPGAERHDAGVGRGLRGHVRLGDAGQLGRGCGRVGEHIGGKDREQVRLRRLRQAGPRRRGRSTNPRS